MSRTYKAVTVDGHKIDLTTEEEIGFCVAVGISGIGYEPFAWTLTAEEARRRYEDAYARGHRNVEIIVVTEVMN